jgi:hypothetical protein
VQSGCPVSIDEIDFGAEGTVSAVVSNRSQLGVVKVQLGWFVLWPNGAVNTSLGTPVEVTIDPRQNAKIIASSLSQKSYRNAAQVLVFIASVDFHQNPRWNADIVRLTRGD